MKYKKKLDNLQIKKEMLKLMKEYKYETNVWGLRPSATIITLAKLVKRIK